MEKIDLTGKIFGKWTVLSRAQNKGITGCWNCKCDCGTERVVRYPHLTSGASRCCGCDKTKRIVHGESINSKNGNFSRKYRTWRSIRSRCLNPNAQNADIYHGLLCDEWNDFSVFNRDVPDPIDDSLTIDRIDNSKGYEPGNVRWATWTEQHRNQSNCRWIEYDGRRQLMVDWSRELNISQSVLSRRLDNYSVEIALSPNFEKYKALGNS